MCKKCGELDKKIAHWRTLSQSILDERTLEGIEVLIRQYEAQKQSLHPKE